MSIKTGQPQSENGQFWSDSEKLNDVQPSTSNFQLTEWALYEKMLQAASAITEHIQNHPRRVTLFQLAKIYELASILGRRAVGMPLDGNETKKPEPRIVRPEIEEALNRVYGPPPQNN